jgi:hypothetical protein
VLHDPFLWKVLGILAAVLTLVGVLMFAFHAFATRLENRIPPYRRELEATYASFRRFLMTVQAVVIRRLQE